MLVVIEAFAVVVNSSSVVVFVTPVVVNSNFVVGIGSSVGVTVVVESLGVVSFVMSFDEPDAVVFAMTSSDDVVDNHWVSVEYIIVVLVE